MKRTKRLFAFYMLSLLGFSNTSFASPHGTHVLRDDHPAHYDDGRPAPIYRLNAQDEGIVLRHGEGRINRTFTGRARPSSTSTKERITYIMTEPVPSVGRPALRLAETCVFGRSLESIYRSANRALRIAARLHRRGFFGTGMSGTCSTLGLRIQPRRPIGFRSHRI